MHTDVSMKAYASEGLSCGLFGEGSVKNLNTLPGSEALSLNSSTQAFSPNFSLIKIFLSKLVL